MPLPEHWQFEAIGTGWDIASQQPLSDVVKRQLSYSIEAFDQTYSRFRSDSIVTRLAREGGSYTFKPEMQFEKLFGFYSALYHKTQGSMTPLVARSLEVLGYDAAYSLRQSAEAIRPRALEEVIQWDGHNQLTYKTPALLDFGAAGKGLLVDIVSEHLRKEGVADFVIDASGDILHQALEPYIVGLEHPEDPTKVIGTVTIENEALCASAVNRRAWAGNHHIIDGRNGKPTSEIIASWVIAGDCMTADGLATAFFFSQKPNTLADEYTAAYLRIYSSGIIETNERMKARVELFS